MKIWPLFFFVGACAGVPVNETANPTANFVEVSPGIYRGARPERAALERMKKELSLKTVLNLEDDMAAVTDESTWAAELGLKQVSCPMTGTSNPDNATVSEALGVLDDPANRPIFVHC